jgi:signal transduction histidine kinase
MFLIFSLGKLNVLPVNNKEIVNIKDVQYDHRFNDQIDHVSGFHTKNMLCFPICNKADEVIGVLQLLNSTKGEFTVMDEEYLKMLSINAALALENAGLVEKLLQSERITSLGKMANFLIQDIKKPVLVSKRYAEHLKNKNLSPEINQVIDMLLEQLTHVADLVQTTSSFSEGKTILHSAACQLNEALGEILSKLESYVTIHNCKLIKEFGSDAKVKLDRKEFYQCCMHIIRNACDAMPEGGVITVATKSTIDSASIIFKDNGLGIPDSIKEKIFEPFMSHGKKEGTGLGLSITKKIVEDHGGTISVESDIGEGATFIITLPTA